MTRSITRRLIVTVLLLEAIAALCLVTALSVNEYRAQRRAFDANLQGTAQAMMGAVVDAEDVTDNVLLDQRGLDLGRDAIYRVTEDNGRVLGSAGNLPDLHIAPERIERVEIDGRGYRFILHHGSRIVDPGMPGGGTLHGINIVYGLPDAHIHHEVMEAVRFFSAVTAVLLGLTAWLMVVLMRRSLQPIHQLARLAGEITPLNWSFRAPRTAMELDELRPLASALETSLARLERSFQQQRRFTSDAAHELKTDIAIVKSSLQLLTMKRRSEEDYSRGVLLALDDFSRLERTVERMLTLARLEQPAAGATGTSFLDDAVAEAVQQSASYAELRNVDVQVHSTPYVLVPIDSRDAALLCSNLLLNALQHTHQNSAVVIHVSVGKSEAVLTVRDFGNGIVESESLLLFEPFYRGDASRSRKSGGTGLGLSICKAICDRVGGSIAITNHPAGGALVTVQLPLLHAPATDEAFSIA